MLLTGDLLHLPIQVRPSRAGCRRTTRTRCSACASRRLVLWRAAQRRDVRVAVPHFARPFGQVDWDRQARAWLGVASRHEERGPRPGPGLPAHQTTLQRKGSRHAASCPDHGSRRPRLPQLQRRLPRRSRDRGRRVHGHADPVHRRPAVPGRRSPASGTRTASRSTTSPSWSRLIRELDVDDVVFSYSDVSHEYVMHKASTVLAAGANFVLLGPDATMLQATRADRGRHARCAPGVGKSPDHPRGRRRAQGRRQARRRGPPPDAVRRPGRAARPAVRGARGPRPATTARSRSARSTSRTSRRHRHLRGRRLRRDPRAGAGRSATSCCGTAATTTSRSTARPSGSRWSTRSAPATSSPTTRARPTCGAADVIVINKMDSATPEQVAQLEATIARGRTRGAVVVKANSQVTLRRPRGASRASACS